MKTILKLWNGHISQEGIHSERIERITKKEKERKDNEQVRERFYKSLSEEQEKLYREYDWTHGEKWCDEVDQAFVDGFRTGVLLMLDVFKEEP